MIVALFSVLLPLFLGALSVGVAVLVFKGVAS